MFGIGTSEFLVILVVAVLVLGPEHLPKIMRTVTRVMSDVRRVSTDFQRTMNLEADQEEWRPRKASASSVKTVKKKDPAVEEAAAPAPYIADELAAETKLPAEDPAAAVAAASAQASDLAAPRRGGQA